MTNAGFGKDRLERLDDVVRAHTEGDVGPSAVTWAVARGGEHHVGAAGSASRDTIFRLSSMTKPVTAVAALVLVEECRLRLDDPVDELLPELADRRVMADPSGPIDQTVPANRPITLHDVLTFRLGLGMDFARWGQQPLLDAMGELGLGAGPPAPAGPPEPDEWMRRLGTLPLEHQPGERWLYHVGADVLGVLVARASGVPFEAFLRERIFDPLGMQDTSFWVPAEKRDRFGPCYVGGGRTVVYDAADGQWSTPPAFPGGGAGLVSTIDDYLAFATMLRHGGDGILSRASVEAMTTDQISSNDWTDFAGAVGWGFGVGVQRRRIGLARSVGSYGWDGGMGSSWANDPAEDLTAVMLTDQMFNGPTLPPAHQDFLTCAYAALRLGDSIGADRRVDATVDEQQRAVHVRRGR